MKQNRGISYSQCVSKRKKQGLDLVAGKTGTNTSSQTNEEQPSPQPPYKKQKTAETHCSDVSNTSIAIPGKPIIPIVFILALEV